MSALYPEIEPYAHGMLDVGDGNRIYWETCGNPNGKSAVILHGGPGSGCTPWHRRLFDPAKYQLVLFDQRNCGRSTPHASAPDTDLASNNTANLIGDIERIRHHLKINRWLVLGGSWGSVLALAYAEQFPKRASELILFGVATGRRKEFDWLFRGGISILFPEQWEQLRASVLAAKRDADVVDCVYRLLHDRDPDVRRQGALAWCTWESATPAWPPTHGLSSRFKDPDFAMCFARIVTHYVRNDAWIEDGSLLRNANSLAAIPGTIINGRFDFQSPLAWAWDLNKAWPRAKLVIVDDAGHDASNAGITGELIRATDQFAND
jgi:proline iminopeptidase